MDAVPLILLVAGMLGAAVAMLALPSYLRRHPDQRGASNAKGGLVGSVDSVFHPEGAAAALALDEEQRLVQPVPTPDGDKGIADGRIRIELKP